MLIRVNHLGCRWLSKSSVILVVCCFVINIRDVHRLPSVCGSSGSCHHIGLLCGSTRSGTKTNPWVVARMRRCYHSMFLPSHFLHLACLRRKKSLNLLVHRFLSQGMDLGDFFLDIFQ